MNLKEILSDPVKDLRYFNMFAALLRAKNEGISDDELKARWRDLKRDAGLLDA